MKDINFAWPLMIGLTAWLYGVSFVIRWLVGLVNGNTSLKSFIFTLLISIAIYFFGWLFIKMAYANKEAA